MTTIAAVRTSQALLMACDTLSASNDGRIWAVKTKLQVLGPPDDRAVVGNCGHGMVSPAMQALGAPKAPGNADEDALDDAVQRWAEELGVDLRERHVPTCEDGLIDEVQLLGWRGRLWMCTDGHAQPIDALHTAVGSGGDLALGFLDAALSAFTEPHHAAGNALLAAIRCAGRHDTATGGEPYLVALGDDGVARDGDGEPL